MVGVVLWLGAGPAWAAEREVPPNDAWVTDTAGLLSAAAEQRLEERMEAYKLGTGHDVALLTVPSLAGDDLQGFALRVSRAWGLGSQETHDGALLLVVADSRQVRIEVGRGLEGELTDAASGRIIRNVIVPEFKAGRIDAGCEAGIAAIHGVLGGDLAVLESHERSQRRRGGGLPSGLLLMLLIVFARLGRGRRGRGGLAGGLFWGALLGGHGRHHGGGFGGGGFGGGGGGFSGFGGGGGFSGGGASGGW